MPDEMRGSLPGANPASQTTNTAGVSHSSIDRSAYLKVLLDKVLAMEQRLEDAITAMDARWEESR
ncbi:hypothetical protein [Methanocalculus sp.]|uniref:hypothetical protein n=1 Tax=Methanocalculus sp. TaxID=2004547 RepID=UPI00262E109A|nr:hypothetical protein [Methanocalculus sp.]MDG6250856.1 hypothetical protein [Methanocalculus sp.]